MKLPLFARGGTEAESPDPLSIPVDPYVQKCCMILSILNSAREELFSLSTPSATVEFLSTAGLLVISPYDQGLYFLEKLVCNRIDLPDLTVLPCFLSLISSCALTLVLPFLNNK